jgi:hypothetical protein
MPAVTARPYCWVAASNSPFSTPAPAGQPPLRVHLDLADGPQVDHQAAVADRPAGHAVAAGPHRDRQAVVASEPDRGNDVRSVLAAGDHRRAPVDRAVPDPASSVVALG